MRKILKTERIWLDSDMLVPGNSTEKSRWIHVSSFQWQVPKAVAAFEGQPGAHFSWILQGCSDIR